MAAKSSDLTALGLLISEVQTANKWSYADIAHNAVGAGRRLSKSRVESLRNDPLPSISVKAIEALAAGLRVPPDKVARAAMDSMGYAAATDGLTPTEALAGDPALSDPMRRVLIAALEAAHDEFASGPPVKARKPRPSAIASGNRLQQSAADEAGTTG